MSETGLLSGLYQQAHKYAELVDRVLVDLKTESSSLGDAGRKELGILLTGISDESLKDLPSHLLIIVLKSRNNLRQLNLGQVGRALLSDEIIDSQVIENLEAFAQALEQEEVDAMTRMRRWTR